MHSSRHKQIGAVTASGNRSPAGRELQGVNLAELRVYNCGQGDEDNRHQERSDLCSHTRVRPCNACQTRQCGTMRCVAPPDSRGTCQVLRANIKIVRAGDMQTNITVHTQKAKQHTSTRVSVQGPEQAGTCNFKCSGEGKLDWTMNWANCKPVGERRTPCSATTHATKCQCASWLQHAVA